MEIILWILSWFYINFLLIYLNKRRNPVEIMILPHLPFTIKWQEVAPHDFLLRSNSAPRHIEKNWHGGRATSFPFWIEIRESAVLEWGRATISLQKECHVRFCPIYGIPREQNACKTRETREFIRDPITQLRHPSPLLFRTRVLPVPLSRRDNVLVLCKKLSKFYEPPLKSFEFFHQVYINLPLSGNVNKRKYRKPSKTVK